MVTMGPVNVPIATIALAPTRPNIDPVRTSQLGGFAITPQQAGVSNYAAAPVATPASGSSSSGASSTSSGTTDPWLSFGQLVAGVLGASAQPSTPAPTVAMIPADGGASSGGTVSNKAIGLVVLVLAIGAGVWWYRKHKRSAA